MILLDADVLIALADDDDQLNPVAEADLEQVGQDTLFLATPVLAEACYMLPRADQRTRLWHLVNALDMRPCVVEDERSLWSEVFGWLASYAEHRPDWVDGCLAVLCGRDKRLRLWTYDKEFSTLWRRPDGSKIPLAVRLR
jgi:predicted nucleic acid-binding protein